MSSGTVKVGVVLHMIEDQPFGILFQEDFGAAMRDGGRDLEVSFGDSHGSAADQLAHVERYLERGVNVLVLSPLDPEQLRPVLRRYRQAKIPVVLVGSDVEGEPALRRCVVQPDNAHFGQKVGEFFVEVSGGRAEILEVQGIASTESARRRSEGLRRAIAGHPGMRIVDTLPGAWRADVAREAIGRWLPAHPGTYCVFAQNDEMARGALEAARKAGRDDDLLITGIDAIKGQGLSLVLRGQLGGTLINPPAGRTAALQVLAILDGDTVLERTVLQTSLLRSNERVRAWQARREQQQRAQVERA